MGGLDIIRKQLTKMNFEELWKRADGLSPTKQMSMSGWQYMILWRLFFGDLDGKNHFFYVLDHFFLLFEFKNTGVNGEEVPY